MARQAFYYILTRTQCEVLYGHNAADNFVYDITGVNTFVSKPSVDTRGAAADAANGDSYWHDLLDSLPIYTAAERNDIVHSVDWAGEPEPEGDGN